MTLHSEYYKKCAQPPSTALKKIQAGRLRGMTDIKPQWRIEALNDTYGLCGFGWKYEIVDKKLLDGSDGQVVGIVDIKLYVKIGDQWSDAIPATGGSSFIANEKGGQHTSDEVFKMALTDAISVAAKAIGIASNIYMGLDESKYSPDNNSNNAGLLLSQDRFNKAIAAWNKGDAKGKQLVVEELRKYTLTDAQSKELEKNKISL